jgi:chorismate--pyruvate lyase
MPTFAPTTSRKPVDRILRRWLQATGSLTAHLSATFGPVEVVRVRQGGGPIDGTERRDLGRGAPAWGHVREVMLLAGGEPRIWARTVLDSAHARQQWRGVRGLGRRPLADLLFSTRRVDRTPLQARRLAGASPLAQRIRRDWQAISATPWPGGAIWVRSSVFWRRGAPLRVMEALAPSLHRTAPRSGSGRISRRLR